MLKRKFALKYFRVLLNKRFAYTACFMGEERWDEVYDIRNFLNPFPYTWHFILAGDAMTRLINPRDDNSTWL